jgi:hypothetical protein
MFRKLAFFLTVLSSFQESNAQHAACSMVGEQCTQQPPGSNVGVAEVCCGSDYMIACNQFTGEIVQQFCGNGCVETAGEDYVECTDPPDASETSDAQASAWGPPIAATAPATAAAPAPTTSNQPLPANAVDWTATDGP